MDLRRCFPLSALILAAGLALPQAAAAQPAVEAAPLPALDLFSTAGRETGLPADLWREASAATAAAVIPLLAEKPLSPAAAALARRVLATGAQGPEGGGNDPALAAARAQALVGLGDPQAARAILGRTAQVSRSEPLSRAAAEAALRVDDEQGACDAAEALTTDRDRIYWLRLRAFCQARAGETAAAQLTFDLAQSVDRDPIYGRLMGAKLAGVGDPGAPALRNGLDYALSRSLGLDPTAAEAAPAVAAALEPEAPTAARWTFVAGPGPVSAAMAVLAQGDLVLAENVRATLVQDEIPEAGALDLALLDALLAAAAGREDRATLDRLVERGGIGDAKARARAQQAAAIFAALGSPMRPQARGEFARFAIGAAKAPEARTLALALASERRLPGETAMLALWIAADAGAGGPAPADRTHIIRALKAAGLEAHARDFAVEGLLALR